MPRKRTDDPVQRVKSEYRAQAKAGRFRQFREFEAMCMSKQGYEPQTAVATLGRYVGDAIAQSLIAAANGHVKIWHHPLAPERPEEAESSGPAFIFIDPVTAGPNQHYKWEQYFLDRGWIMPAGYQRAVPDPFEAGAPKRTAEVDRAALIAKLKKPEPEDGGESNGGESA